MGMFVGKVTDGATAMLRQNPPRHRFVEFRWERGEGPLRMDLGSVGESTGSLDPAVSHRKAQPPVLWAQLECGSLGEDVLRGTVTAPCAPQALPVLPAGSSQA